MTVSNTKVTHGDVFKHLEDFGRFQTYQYFLICLPLVMVSMTHVNYVFVAEDVDYRCSVPACESDASTSEIPIWWPSNVDGKCFRPVLDMDRYNANNYTCSNTTFMEVLEECEELIYENNNSIVAEFNLGCQSWKATLVGSVHNTGMIVSMMFAGWITDKLGRKPTTIICAVGGIIGVSKIFISNYYAYLTVEFLEALMGSGLYTVAIVLLIELGGESKRVMAGVIFSYAVYVGEVTFAFAAMGLKYWKHLILFVYAPLLLFISYCLILHESPRWEMLRGKTNQAKETFKSIAKMNKLDLTSKEIDDMNDAELRKKLNIEIQERKENIKDIFASRDIMIRLAVTSFCFFTSSFLYYGMIVHSVLLPGNKYTNFVLASVTSFPGDMLAFYTFNKYGRRITLQYGYFFSALFLIAQTCSPESITWLKVLLFLVGKLCVVVCFTGIYTYSLELFPTSVRGSLVGCGNTAARVGSMLAPLTPLLTSQLTALPSILFASTALVSTILLTFTPETKNLPMFDTIAQSPRWEMLRGKTNQAKETFKSIAKMNKLDLTSKEIDDMNDAELRKKLNIEIQERKENIKDIFASRDIMIRLAVTSFCFFTSSFLYYGMIVHSVLLPGNKYTNFVLASVTSFPGDMLAFYTFNKYGRRITLQYGYFFSALFLIAQTCSPESITWLKVLLFLVGKLCVVVCFTGIYTYSLELFPTSVRGSLVGCGNTAARVGSMLAPLTPLLTSQLTALPSILFASTALVSTILLTFTPETKNLPMFDTIAQVQAYETKVTTHL